MSAPGEVKAPEPGEPEFKGSGIGWAFRSIAQDMRISAASGRGFIALVAETAAEYFEAEAEKADRAYGTPTVESAIGTKRGIASGVVSGREQLSPGHCDCGIYYLPSAATSMPARDGIIHTQAACRRPELQR